MHALRVLFVSGSFGLGHVTRDLAIAAAMRRLRPDVEILWLAAAPAAEVLVAAGERLVPQYVDYQCETDLAEAAASSGRLSLTAYVFRALRAWIHNARLIGSVAAHGEFDVIIGDETYEVPVANFFGIHVLRDIPFVMAYDFWGTEVTSGSVWERLGAWALNLIWTQEWRVTARGRNAAVFFGEIEDLPDRRFGLLLPQRRQYAADHVEFVGYALSFDAGAVPARDTLRRELGYADEPFVLCSVGGTSIGRGLLELCGRAFPLAAARVGRVRMLLVAGPRIDPGSLAVPEGVECRGMVPQLWRHMAACDLAVVQGGGTTTLELEALRVPYLVFPSRAPVRAGGHHCVPSGAARRRSEDAPVDDDARKAGRRNHRQPWCRSVLPTDTDRWRRADRAASVGTCRAVVILTAGCEKGPCNAARVPGCQIGFVSSARAAFRPLELSPADPKSAAYPLLLRVDTGGPIRAARLHFPSAHDRVTVNRQLLFLC
jgi:UDP:flavonoid glycosyltransferase YjiC (YdhE family)